MNWSDERYVRFYTRNTPEWLALSWQARALFGLLLREVDRAGVLKLGRVGARGVAVVLHAPWPEVEASLGELVADGCVQINGEYLLIPNFQAAQEANQSDRARQARSRELRRAQALPVTNRDSDVTPCDSDVTPCDTTSRPVTRGHTTSHGVTPSVLCRAVPCRAEDEMIPSGSSSGAGRQDTPAEVSFALVPAEVQAVEVAERGPVALAIEVVESRFRGYGHTLRPSAKSPHRKHLRARLAEGWSAEDLALAVDGNHCDAWHAKVGKHDLAYVFRTSEQVARFVDLAKSGGNVDMAREIERAAVAREYGSDEP